MKKIIALMLAATLLLMLTACGNTPAEHTSSIDLPSETTGSSTATTPEVPTPVIPASPVDDIPLETILYLLIDMTDVGLNYMNRGELTPEAAGYTIGYADFAGKFESAMALTPQMNVTPFVLALFRLEEGADTSAFAKDLLDHANLNKWICVSADKAVARGSGRTVLFMMCSEQFEAPITEAFDKIAAPGFKPSEFLKDPLADMHPADLYGKLLETYSTEMYGFMDNKDVTKVTAESGYGLSAVDKAQIKDSIFDEGHALPDDIFTDERSYVLAVFELADGVSGETFAASLKEKLNVKGLAGDTDPEGLIAYSDRLVLLFVGTGSNTYSTFSLTADLSNLYRMTVSPLSF